MEIIDALDLIRLQYESILSSVGRLKKEYDELAAAGIEYGSPSYKEGRYLRIIRPTVEGEGRKFDYIGSDPERQKVALEALDRGKQADVILEKLGGYEKRLDQLKWDLSSICSRFDWSKSERQF